jgi:hypothetical protein
MKVVTRLNLTILPAVIGLCTVSALAYWGEFERQAPTVVVVLAVVATVGSAYVAWHNTRVISHRLGEVAAAKASLRRTTDARVEAADARVARSEHLMRDVVQLSLKQIEEARLALHILQSNPFGELNENQEELVAAARTAMDTADSELRTMARVVSLSSRTGVPTASAIRLRSLLEVPLAMAVGGIQEVREAVRLPQLDELPAVAVDVPAVQEALSLLFRDCVAAHPPGEPLTILGSHTPPNVTLNIPMDTSAYIGTPPLRFHLAKALLESSGVPLVVREGTLGLQFLEAP